MIFCTANRLRYPLDTNQLYRLALTGRDNPLTNYFFSSADGTRLVDATEDVPRFEAAIQDVLTVYPAIGCAAEMREVLQLLTPPMPVPIRYPAAGDTNVSGYIRRVYTGDGWSQFYDQGVQFTIWAGRIVVDLEANGYSMPPAYMDSDFGFDLGFSLRTPVLTGQAVIFDIEQCPYALGATNVRTV